MAMDKKEIALTVGGIVAGLALTYLLYRLEQNNAAASQASADAAASSAASQQAYQSISLPSISVPSISSTPSTDPSPTDTSNQSHVPAFDSTLADLLASVMSEDKTPVTNTSSLIGSITELPFNTTSNIPSVVVPQIIDFSSTQRSPVSSPIRVDTNNI